MVRIPAIDRSLGSLPRSHSRREVTPTRRPGSADFDIPTRGFARELAEIDPSRLPAEISETRRDWRADAYDAPRRRNPWKLLDILV